MIGDRIKVFRIKSGIRQVELAEQLGVSQAAITNWERGNSQPTRDNIAKLAQIFNCSTDALYNLAPAPERKGDIWELYAALQPDQKQTIQQMIVAFSRLNKDDEEQSV